MELDLKNNNFEFDGKHYLQKTGTAIGTRMAPSYANLFMHDLESRLLAWVPVKPFIWLRYIDDIFMVWTKGEKKLLEFLKNINNFHDTIKFTFDWSRDCINYLDVQVINKGGVIETDLYTKPISLLTSISTFITHPVILRVVNVAFRILRPLG